MLAVLKPLKVVIDNYPVDQVDELDAINNPEDPAAGTRKVPFTRELYIEQRRFPRGSAEGVLPPVAGREVRLRYAYLVTCTSVVKDEKTGEVTELHCTYDPATRGGNTPDGRKVKGTIHWVSAPSRCRPRSGCTITCSPSPIPATCRPAETIATT